MCKMGFFCYELTGMHTHTHTYRKILIFKSAPCLLQNLLTDGPYSHDKSLWPLTPTLIKCVFECYHWSAELYWTNYGPNFERSINLLSDTHFITLISQQHRRLLNGTQWPFTVTSSLWPLLIGPRVPHWLLVIGINECWQFSWKRFKNRKKKPWSFTVTNSSGVKKKLNKKCHVASKVSGFHLVNQVISSQPLMEFCTYNTTSLHAAQRCGAIVHVKTLRVARC